MGPCQQTPLTAFGKRLDKDQWALIRSDVTIADDNKLQFYLEEIYDSIHFDKQEMLPWEREPSATKTDFTLAKAHFEVIVNATNIYEQNTGGGTTGRNRYDSANQMADYGNEIREHIQQLASAGAAKATDTAANIQIKEKLTSMEAEIKKLTTTITLVTSKFNGKNINPNKEDHGGSKQNSRRPQIKTLRNMGAYCSLHIFHPVGLNHNSTTCNRKKPKHKTEATWSNRLGGDMYWPTANRVAVKQQSHPSWKGMTAPTNLHQPRNATMKIMDHAALNIKQRLASNFYSCLSPLLCQVEEHEPDRTNIVSDNVKCQAVLSDTINIAPVAKARSQNKIATKWTKRLEQRQAKRILANTVDSMIHQSKWQYIIGVDDEELRQGIMDRTIPSTIADSGATSGVGTKDNPSHHTGEPSNKQFILPSGQLIQATEKAEYPFNIKAPTNELHITPGVSQYSLLSTGKYADANYITVFDKDTINVYNANDTVITVTKEAILRGWRDKDNKLWCIPLVDMV